MKLDNFEFQENGRCLLTACLEIVAYSNTTAADGGEGFAAFYEVFRKRFGKAIKLYNTANMSGMKKANKEALEMVPFWFSDEEALKSPTLAMYMHSGEASETATAPTPALHHTHDASSRASHTDIAQRA